MKQFGGKITNALKERYAQSPHWKDNKFHNLEETKMDFHFHDIPRLLYNQFCESEGWEPEHPLPVVAFDRQAFLHSEEPAFIWYGHSALLMRLNGLTIMIDPMLGPDAAPIAPFSAKRFSKNTLEIIEELPEIDLLLISHDHYDHLDLTSIRKLSPLVRNTFTALGVGRHLDYWKTGQGGLKEFDWWDSHEFNGIEITFTPSRHFSGRGIRDRFRSLWGGWVLRVGDKSVYFSGDGGYGKHFSEAGERLGPFSIGFMECGQYNALWHQIHMYPEEAVQAAIDSGVQTAVPVHWGAFSLAQHTWKDPVERFASSAGEHHLKFFSPRLGEIFYLTSSPGAWWENYT